MATNCCYRERCELMKSAVTAAAADDLTVNWHREVAWRSVTSTSRHCSWRSMTMTSMTTVAMTPPSLHPTTPSLRPAMTQCHVIQRHIMSHAHHHTVSLKHSAHSRSTNSSTSSMSLEMSLQCLRLVSVLISTSRGNKRYLKLTSLVPRSLFSVFLNIMMTNPRDAFRGQSRSPNMVPFNMVSY